jgi:anaerobic ribonucleoside-triphosphate reductase activating protein
LPASVTATRLKIGGVTPFSATDYPGKLTAVVFVQGCPWRCGYCHNPHLQTRTGASPLAWIDVIALLKRRIGLIDAVVFSGGEPTMDPALADAMGEVRALGLGVGLHTAGMYPRRLAEVLPLVDWVGIDVKAKPEDYDAITGISNSAQHIVACAKLVLDSGLAHEFRTTIHPSLHPENEILALAQTLSAMGVQHYALQLFRSTGCTAQRLNALPTAGYPGADLLANVSALFATFTFRQA